MSRSPEKTLELFSAHIPLKLSSFPGGLYGLWESYSLHVQFSIQSKTEGDPMYIPGVLPWTTSFSGQQIPAASAYQISSLYQLSSGHHVRAWVPPSCLQGGNLGSCPPHCFPSLKDHNPTRPVIHSLKIRASYLLSSSLVYGRRARTSYSVMARLSDLH